MRLAAVIIGLVAVLLLPAWACADCVDISGARWSRVDTHKIILYRYSRAIALLEIPYCYIYSSSEIIIIEDYVCNWDKIMVDDEVLRHQEGHEILSPRANPR